MEVHICKVHQQVFTLTVVYMCLTVSALIFLKYSGSPQMQNPLIDMKNGLLQNHKIESHLLENIDTAVKGCQ